MNALNGTDPKIDALLMRIARDWTVHSCGDDSCDLEADACLAKVLRNKLGPLLTLAMQSFELHGDYCFVGDPDQEHYPADSLRKWARSPQEQTSK